MPMNLLQYRLGAGVEAFTATRDSVLPYPVIQGHQVHGTEVAIIDRPGLTREDLEGYDAFITDIPGIAIGVRTADCTPVLLFDPLGVEDIPEDRPPYGRGFRDVSRRSLRRNRTLYRAGQFPGGRRGRGTVQGCWLPNVWNMDGSRPWKRLPDVRRPPHRPLQGQQMDLGRMRLEARKHPDLRHRHVHRPILLFRQAGRSRLRKEHQFNQADIGL